MKITYLKEKIMKAQSILVHADEMYKSLLTLYGTPIINGVSFDYGFSKLPSPEFNYMRLKDTQLVGLKEILQNTDTPFICLPAATLPYDKFSQKAKEYGLVHFCDLVLQSFDNLEGFTYNPPLNIVVKQIDSLTDLEIFDHISSTSFGHPVSYAYQYLKPSLGTKNVLLFLAYYQDQPAGCSMLFLHDGVAGCYWDGVLPEFRRKGIATTFTQARMILAKKLGYQQVCVQNMDSSIRYYQQIGFKPMGTVPLFGRLS